MKDIFFQNEDLYKTKFLACSLLFDRQICQTFNIVDLKGFSLSMWNKNTTRLVKFIAKLSQDYYPEVMGKMVVCHAPVVVAGIWSIIKGWIDEKTRSKVSIHNSNYQKVLFEDCDPDQIPISLGGSLESHISEEFGPWSDYELIDSSEPGA
mmetsp:Transcript_2040/g.3050  ORF Transcript_2040/g.3050 Transcript_2040/m.3050 type:complete len:151 (+) Transcript_2040:396-848(+)